MQFVVVNEIWRRLEEGRHLFLFFLFNRQKGGQTPAYTTLLDENINQNLHNQDFLRVKMLHLLDVDVFVMVGAVAFEA